MQTQCGTTTTTSYYYYCDGDNGADNVNVVKRVGGHDVQFVREDNR